MYVRSIVAILVLNTILFASEPAPCPANRPVDDIITEVNKQKSKKNSRNKNPLPQNICIFGWCRGSAGTPPTLPEPAPRVEPRGDTSVSSSKDPADQCRQAIESALQAAHNVEVGDYNFAEKNYRGALMRYQDALEQKAGDAAIEVRLGRVFEKLNDPQRALEHYQAAEKLSSPEKFMNETREALLRLHAQPAAVPDTKSR